jgi:kumamolisin
MNIRTRLFALALGTPVLFAGAALSATSATAAPPTTTVISNNVAPDLANVQSTGDVADDKQFSVSVALKLRNTTALHQFLADVSNPHSARYGHYLTPAQFMSDYGPTRASVDAVSKDLTSAGLHVSKISANRQAVDATGTAAQLRAAFGTTIGSYYDQSQHRAFYANKTAPALPTSIANVVQGIAGLEDHYLPHHSVTKPTATPDGYGPSDLRGAYDVPAGADGSGVTVALWEFDAFPAADITAYDQQYNLNSPTPSVVNVDGGQSSPAGGEDEVDLDIQTIQAMAPAANQIVYEAPEPGNDDNAFQKEEIDEANQIVSDDKASIVSMSWGMCEPQRDASLMQSADNAFAQGAAEGIGWFAASGDDGSADCGSGADSVDFPASDPNITGVGGTSLTVNNGSYGGESAWNGSGGGTSTVFSNPSYQQGVGGKRTVPDVSSLADPNTGVASYSDGQWGVAGGTSLAAPLWASFAALYDQQAKAAGKSALGPANAALYQVAAGSSAGSAFHDITDGSNGGFSAGTGYDQVTGLGSYDFGNLAKALGA